MLFSNVLQLWRSIYYTRIGVARMEERMKCMTKLRKTAHFYAISSRILA